MPSGVSQGAAVPATFSAAAVAKSTVAKFGIWVIAGFRADAICLSGQSYHAPQQRSKPLRLRRILRILPPPAHDQPECRAADRASDCAVRPEAADDRPGT